MANDKESKGSKKLIVVIGVILALVIVAGGVYVFTVKSVSKKVVQQQQPPQLNFCDLGNMLINLDNGKDGKYLQTQVALGYDAENKKIAEELKRVTPLLKDSTIYYLKGKKASDFTSEDKSKLKEGLLRIINKQLTDGQIKDVCFQQLTIQ